MATKVIIQIQGNLYDFWECRSLERAERYNENEGRLDYLLIMNRQAIATNYTRVEFAYPNEELRELDFKNIKEQLDFFEGVLFLNAGMPLKDIKAAIAQINTNTEDEEEYDENED